MPGKKIDIFVNRASVKVVQTSINTLVFNKLDTSISLHEKVAWIIHRIEYWIDKGTIAQLLAIGDLIWVGFTSSDQLSDLNPDRAAMIDARMYLTQVVGAAADFEIVECPIISDFTTFPGGGLLTPPEPLYLGLFTYSLTAVATLRARIYYTMKQLTKEDYWDLVETTRLTG